MKRVAEGIYLIEACAPANVYLLQGSNDLTLVDAGPAQRAESLRAELRDNGFRLEDVQRAIVTHAHPGHCGGLSPLHASHRFKVYAHPKDIPALTGKAPLLESRAWKRFWRGFYDAETTAWEPLQVALPVEPSQPLRGLPQWQVMHLPGHTAGSIGLFHPASQVLLCGDALSNRDGRLQLPDEESLADAGAARTTLAQLAGIDCDILGCGHGPLLRAGAFRFIGKLLKPS